MLPAVPERPPGPAAPERSHVRKNLGVSERFPCLATLGLLSGAEREAVGRLYESEFPFAEALERAETVHLHVKVDDVGALPRDEIAAAGGRAEYEKEGFVKFNMPGGLNLIFSSIAISQDDLAETDSARQPRPFLDHVGIDLREESEAVRATFDEIVCRAAKVGWDRVAQGEGGGGVHCCHVEVKRKHWVYPPEPACDRQVAVPLEFAFGELKVNDVAGGCDLRPTAPAAIAAGATVPECAAH